MPSSFFQGNFENSTRILYTPSEFAKTNLIHLQETGELQAGSPHTNSRSGISSYLFFIVVKGKGILKYDGNTYTLKNGDCVFIDCHKPYSHSTSEHLWGLKWVHFYGPNMNGIYKKYVERGGRHNFTSSFPEKYIQILDEIFQIASSSIFIKDMKIFEQLTSLLTLLMEESWSPNTNSNKKTYGKRDLQDVKEYIDIHFCEKVMLDNLAEQFFINKYYLTRTFKEQFGLSINQYILQQRITYAKQLLRFTEHSIEYIGRLCGIPDANYFARMFKKVEGIAPGEYRKRW